MREKVYREARLNRPTRVSTDEREDTRGKKHGWVGGGGGETTRRERRMGNGSELPSASGGESTSAVRIREVRSQSASAAAGCAGLVGLAGESRRYITRLYH